MTLPLAVAGTGLHLPDPVVTNQRLTELLDTTDEWIVSRTGIRERRWLEPELAASDMCVAAARQALGAAEIRACDVDVIIIATYTWDQPLPSTALIVKAALGAERALTLDITQAACANGMQAMLLAAHLLQTSARTALVIAADCASRVTDPDERTSRVFFGDAAAAAVLTRSPDPEAGLLGWDFGSELSYGVEIQAGGSRTPASPQTVAERRHYLKMDGREVWNTATLCLPESILTATGRAGVAVTDVEHFFLHQANVNIVNAAMDKLGVARERAPITLDKLGNTGSAGVFTALHESFSQGLVGSGDTYVMSAIGAGFQWGSLCLRHA
ncbi:3-oxoacyl-[acyl-carrier-protein] synthase-3 [Amycolatopsis xylanica]|uniref:3-oxoacyl-[acyl-carrier-protein] synthase-3 n=1 Tax=Amycolatopsis xylanica TaxID=589385 RepID=A0A1H3DH44_9PSEU|nr:ketoacyl-ACP synthase III [Amycolatopsis xylanica]SDX65735.1 3-oxoacyl-[acyl-carrier-protein] synthase-3 [Amycolatopsis xylanica]